MSFGHVLKYYKEKFVSFPEEEKNTHVVLKDYRIYLAIIFLYPIFQLAIQPSWMMGGEMWAEMATNYYTNANSSSWISRFFATDAGYIPFLQRIISLFATLIRLPVETIPYYYTWVGIILTGMMGGVFCLPCFRVLIKNDYFRFFTSIVILLGMDFETKTFINFTYINIIPIALCSILAIYDSKNNFPKWVWIIPILFCSKPAVMAAMPAVLVGGIFSAGRFRIVALISLLVCTIQIFMMKLTHNIGGFPEIVHYSFFQKIQALIIYCLSFMSEILLGSGGDNGKFLVISGFIVLLVFSLSFYFIRGKGNSFVFVGFSLLVFNLLINVFALSGDWNIHFARGTRFIFTRHATVSFFGCIFMLVGIFDGIGEKIFKKYDAFYGIFPVSLFLIWCISTNIFHKTFNNNHVPEMPMVGNSMWLEMAPEIKLAGPTLCVPINPLAWAYGNCHALINNNFLQFQAVETTAGKVEVVFFPHQLLDGEIFILSIIAKPSIGVGNINAKILVKTKSGKEVLFSGSRIVTQKGGLIALKSKDLIKLSEIDKMEIMTDIPVELGYNATMPVVIPFGR